jgi:hypothetical protein
LAECGNNVIYGYEDEESTKPPNGPNGTVIPDSGIGFTGGEPLRADFNPDGSAGTTGSVYFQHVERGYSYAVRVSNTSGLLNVWRWDGDNEEGNTDNTDWTEIR